MHEIISTKKMENGIAVYYLENEQKKFEGFNYSELIDMKINALDLLASPKGYKVDVAGHKILMKK